MFRTTAVRLTMVLSVALLTPAAVSGAAAKEITATGETSVSGFAYPESVAYDPDAKVLYVSEFVSELKPTQKDGKGRISKVGLDGKVIEETFLPAAGMTMDKPKGIWVAGGRLWTTDIDSVWVFDLATKKGRKLPLPGIQFANDPTIVGDTLYVSDNRGDQLYSVTPADFLDTAEPKVEKVFAGKSINPNGLYPGADGALLMVGFAGKDDPRGIYRLAAGGEPMALTQEGLGRLDGLYQVEDGPLLVTDWNSGSLFAWTANAGMAGLADGFKGPADFAVVPTDSGITVVVPDLVKSELRFVQLSVGM